MAVGEWDQRQLCPDGGCIGIIGPDGTCKVCGRVAPDWGDERRRGLIAADVGEDGAGDDADADADELSPSAPAALGEVAEWNRRRLCSNGGCIGVIGPDGTCKVCGKPAAQGAAKSEAKGDEDDDDDSKDDDSEDDDDEDSEDDDDKDSEDSEDDDDEDSKDAADAAAAATHSGGDDSDDRRLCPDGACIGVIGPDGTCKVCGKEAA